MFRDTLSVSWSYSCYILCCWLAINILIVLAFFSFTALSSTRVVLTQFNPAFWYFYWCAKNLQKSCVFFIVWFWPTKIRENHVKAIFCTKWKIGGLNPGLPMLPCFSFVLWLFMKTFDSSTVIPKYRIDLYETHSNRVPYICHNFEKSKTGSSRVKDQRERGVYLFLLFAVHGKYWGMVASSSSCLWGNEKPVKKWKQPKGKNLI